MLLFGTHHIKHVFVHVPYPYMRIVMVPLPSDHVHVLRYFYVLEVRFSALCGRPENIIRRCAIVKIAFFTKMHKAHGIIKCKFCHAAGFDVLNYMFFSESFKARFNDELIHDFRCDRAGKECSIVVTAI